MQIVWTNDAINSVRDFAKTTLEEFGERQVDKLYSEINKVVRRIVMFPESFPLEQTLTEKNATFRYATIFKKYELIYHIKNEDMCEVLLLWNPRRNPKELNFAIKRTNLEE